MSCKKCKQQKCCCCEKTIRGAKGDMGPRGPKGATGATGPQGPDGTFPSYEVTANNNQSVNGAQVDLAITDATLAIPSSGTYLCMFDLDIMNLSDVTNGTYGFVVDGTPVNAPRQYGANPGMSYQQGIYKWAMNEIITLIAPGTLTVEINQAAGNGNIKRFAMIVLKIA